MYEMLNSVFRDTEYVDYVNNTLTNDDAYKSIVEDANKLSIQVISVPS